MNIIPAIDLYNGKCVRLYQGRFDDMTVYSHDAVATARDYRAQGATQLHIIDLNGAECGTFTQLELILAIKKATSLTLQVGGGLRNIEPIQSVLECNIDKVIIGSLAVNNPSAVKMLLSHYGVARIVLALDVTIGDEILVVTHGWQITSSLNLDTLLKQYQAFSGLQILCTDVSRDGTLSGPNFELYADCTQRFPQFQFQASGGVRNTSDLIQLKQCNVAAVIIGKALYESRIILNEIF